LDSIRGSLIVNFEKIKIQHDKKRNLVDDADARFSVLLLGLCGRQ
jgi:hypothetical protein